MKKFLKIFIILEILLFAYIFNSSIYNIYEKNNIAADNLSGYVIEETSPETLNQFYSIFTENYPNNKIELINNTLTSTDNSVYDLYCYPLDKFEQKQPVSQIIEFKYHTSYSLKKIGIRIFQYSSKRNSFGRRKQNHIS